VNPTTQDPGGQYEGYLAAPGVRPGSATETFAALRLEIDNWRWTGVPFYLRAGKLLAESVTEIRVIFQRPPRLASAPDPAELGLRIEPGSPAFFARTRPARMGT
jgi:glucose-6-phosphate 1-dehydrogenase